VKARYKDGKNKKREEIREINKMAKPEAKKKETANLKIYV